MTLDQASGQVWKAQIPFKSGFLLQQRRWQQQQSHIIDEPFSFSLSSCCWRAHLYWGEPTQGDGGLVEDIPWNPCSYQINHSPMPKALCDKSAKSNILWKFSGHPVVTIIDVTIKHFITWCSHFQELFYNSLPVEQKTIKGRTLFSLSKLIKFLSKWILCKNKNDHLTSTRSLKPKQDWVKSKVDRVNDLRLGDIFLDLLKVHATHHLIETSWKLRKVDNPDITTCAFWPQVGQARPPPRKANYAG